MDNRTSGMLKPTLMAGLLFGALASVPFVDVLNICTCCSLVIACGFVASYFYSKDCRQRGIAFQPGTGALVGLLAGAFYAVSTTVFGTLFHAVIGQPGAHWLFEKVQQWPNLPPEAADQLDEKLQDLESGGVNIIEIVTGFFGSLFLAAVFSTLGGLIGGAVFKVTTPPAAPPRVDLPPFDGQSPPRL